MDEVKAVFSLMGPDIENDELIVGRQGLRVGRGSDNNLVLNHREISRQHMRITWRNDDKFLVEDLNSSNGVFFNDTRIPARVAQELNEGDTLRVGPFILRFERMMIQQTQRRRQAVASDRNGNVEMPSFFASYVPGIPSDKSNWIQYLPAIYHDDEFMVRYLLIFESILEPIIWTIDNFDLFLTTDLAPKDWLQWIASWFDLLLLPELPIERQRAVMRQVGWLFMRRGTRLGLQRLLELYYDVTPEIIETVPCHFVVRLPLSQSNIKLGDDVPDRLINAQRPAFASYTIEIT